MIPVLGYEHAWGLTPRQLYNHVLLRHPEREREIKDMAIAARMAQVDAKDFKRWLKKD